MFEEFKTRRGYDMLKWMPVLAGEVIGSPEESDKFLWDWRMNISDLYAANYDLLTEIAQKDYGMLGRYGESHEAGRAFMGDGMDVKRTAQVPMSAMWCAAPWLGRTPDGDYNREVYMADDRESASVAHIYGQNVAAAESMTDIGGPAYAYCPENLKFVADIELANGINRFVIHESAHQPSDVHVPGLSLGGCGQWFNRHDTWAEMANVWTDYMARSCFMLQAGKNVADILYYYGEDNSVCSEFGRFPSMPKGYEWDYCNPHALINAINPRNGKLVSKGGTEYEMLLMDRNMEYVSVKVLRRIAELADAGVVISAVKPQYAASLADDKAEFDALVADIFESGRKNVYVDTPIEEVLKSEGLEPDVIMDPDMKYLHRTMKNTEIYWINKAAKDYRSVKLSFRTNGMKPTLWHPDTGLIEDVTYHIDGDRTVVELDMVPDDAVFVVFNGIAEDSYTVPEKKENTVLTVQSPWTVKFQEGRGAPAERVFDKLQCYTQSEEFGIKYFSGVASYNNTIVMEEISGDAVIDLGSVKNIAEVYVNGEYRGVYSLCEQNQVQEYRVNITENPNSVKTGYLVEMTGYAVDPKFSMDMGSGWFNFEIKNDLSTSSSTYNAQFAFIEDYMRKCWAAVQGGNEAQIRALIDIESVVDTYIVEELFKNLDAGWDSFYMYFDNGIEGDVLHFGPIWDFDLSGGNCDEPTGCDQYTGLRAGTTGCNPWYGVLLQQSWFRKLVADRWNELKGLTDEIPSLIIAEAERGYNAYCRNFEKWKIFGTQINREPAAIRALKTYKEHYEYYAQWMQNRIDWLDSYFGSPAYFFDGKLNLSGRGTANSPYLVTSAADFLNLTLCMQNGQNFSGKYFRQTANIDMTGIAGYEGVGSSCTFAGIYDGAGYTIRVNLKGNDQCIFPYLTGTVMNLFTEGSIQNSAQAAGICRSVRIGGKIINCGSSMTLSGSYAGGMAASNQGGGGLIAGCVFVGSVNGTDSASPINCYADGRGGTYLGNYYKEGITHTTAGADWGTPKNETALATAQMADALNAGKKAVADAAGVSENNLCQWTTVDGIPAMQTK